MGLESELKKFLSGCADKMKKCDDFVELRKNEDKMKQCDVSAESKKDEDKTKQCDVFAESKKDEDKTKQCDVFAEGEEMRNVDAPEKRFASVQGDNVDCSMAKDDKSVGRKRKRECFLETLDWMRTVAKDPCNTVTGGPLPESKMWNKYGNELHWKKILLVRRELILQGNADVSSQQSIWKKLQKLHPVMYDDGTGQGLRCSQRIATAKVPPHKSKEMSTSESSSPAHKQSKSTADTFNCLGKREKDVSIGPRFQATQPEFVGTNYESDSKWLGTRVWPLDKGELNRNLIERDPIGKGRQESCGCQFPGSLECVRFHVGEKRTKVKFELGSAFNLWKFDRMGEEVALSWTKDDETKFSQIVDLNLLSEGKCFWGELFKIFSRKGREALVSYYFNVFLLRRRSDQNRNQDGNFDSDDGESEYGPIANRFGQKACLSPGSIFGSPKKPHQNR